MSDFFWPSIPLTVFAAVNKTILIWFDLTLLSNSDREHGVVQVYESVNDTTVGRHFV